MKNLKSKLPLLTLLIGMGIVFVQSAFSPANPKRVSTYWRYNSTDPAQSQTGTNYTLITDPNAQECPSGDEVPCVLEAPESITTQTDLDTYLHSTFASPAAVNASPTAIRKKLGD